MGAEGEAAFQLCGVGVGWEGRFHSSRCDSYKRSLSAFSVFLRRKPRLEVWFSNAGACSCSHTPVSMLLLKPTWHPAGDGPPG